MATRVIPAQYYLPSTRFTPAYLNLGLAELRRRAAEGLELLRDCVACPRDCHVNRLDDKFAVCKTGRHAIVGSFFAHFGEEDCLRGWRGSGTIFFSMCNLRCAFCQNYDISQAGEGRVATPDQLAAMMLHLQDQGCHNINFVTPEHVVPQILEALPIAVERGLRLPIVYNTSSYDSMHSLHLMDGIVDIYMPDFKFWDREMSRHYMKAPDYPEVARRTIAEMHRQVGPLVLDEFALAKRGLIIRHLVMPGGIAGTQEIMQWIAQALGPDTYVNVMAQYYPAGQVGTNPKYDAINRKIFPQESEEAVRAARAAGLFRLDIRQPRHPLMRWIPSLPLSTPTPDPESPVAAPGGRPR